MNLPISNRLLACCGFVRQGDRVADIGCDHGYLGIHLLTKGVAASVIAADVNQMPLQSALHNAHKYGVADKMRFFLSDGVRNIPRDFDTLVCAGMGADTMISILDAAPWLKSETYRLILQCQSRRSVLREYLSREGYRITRETLAQDGKFIYPIMEVSYDPGEALSAAQCHISPALLECESPLLPAFYRRVMEGMEVTLTGLSRSGGEKYQQFKDLYEDLKKMEAAVYGNCE